MPPPPSAPWKQVFTSQVQTLPVPTFSFATISSQSSTVGNASSTESTWSPTPHVRTLIFRGFYSSLPYNPHNPTPSPNTTNFSSNLLTYTTDKRMEKYRDLGSMDGISPTPTSPNNHSNRNNRIEACFWIPKKENPLLGYQWRIRGRSYVLPPVWDEEQKDGSGIDPNSTDEYEKIIKETKEWLLSKLKREDSAAEDVEFDFEAEHRSQFANLSPTLRGTFKSPPPTQPHQLGPGRNPNWAPGQHVSNSDLSDPVALENFRVCIIDPSRVEYLDLGNGSPGEARKVVWVVEGGEAEKEEGLEGFGMVVEGTGWKEVDLWP